MRCIVSAGFISIDAMHTLSPCAMTELAKSFEPAAIEARWAPLWEQSGVYQPTLDATKPSFCIQLPPAKFVFEDDDRRGTAVDSLIAGGCIISGASVKRSLLFSSVDVHSWATVEDSVILPGVDIGRHAVLKRCVVDKQCRIPEGMVIGVNPEEDKKRFHVSPKGITLVTAEMLGQGAATPR